MNRKIGKDAFYLFVNMKNIFSAKDIQRPKKFGRFFYAKILIKNVSTLKVDKSSAWKFKQLRDRQLYNHDENVEKRRGSPCLIFFHNLLIIN